MGGGPPGFKPGYTCPVLLWCHLGVCCISPTGISPSSSGLSRTVRLYITCPCWWSATPEDKSSGLASFPFARRYLGNRCFFLFLGLLRCFSSPRFLLTGYVFACGYLHITAGGFPHSDICGSSDICSSPQLFAACHVLHRLPVPRHPPYALSNLTKLRLPVASGRSFLSLLLLNVKCLVSLG